MGTFVLVSVSIHAFSYKRPESHSDINIAYAYTLTLFISSKRNLTIWSGSAILSVFKYEYIVLAVKVWKIPGERRA